MWDQLLKLNEMAVPVPLAGNDPIMPEISFADTRSEFVGEAIQRGITAAKATFKLDAKAKPDLIFVNLPNKGAPWLFLFPFLFFLCVCVWAGDLARTSGSMSGACSAPCAKATRLQAEGQGQARPHLCEPVQQGCAFCFAAAGAGISGSLFGACPTPLGLLPAMQ